MASPIDVLQQALAQKLAQQEQLQKEIQQLQQCIQTLKPSECATQSVVDPKTITKEKTQKDVQTPQQVAASAILKEKDEVKPALRPQQLIKFYVLYNGEYKGIYEDWATVKVLISRTRNPIHKSFTSKKEAEDSIKSYKEVLVAPVPKRSLDLLGTTPTIAEVRHQRIQQRIKEITILEWNNAIRMIKDYDIKEPSFAAYPVWNGVYTKFNTLPGIDEDFLRLIFDLRLIETMYIKEKNPCYTAQWNHRCPF